MPGRVVGHCRARPPTSAAQDPLPLLFPLGVGEDEERTRAGSKLGIHRRAPVHEGTRVQVQCEATSLSPPSPRECRKRACEIGSNDHGQGRPHNRCHRRNHHPGVLLAPRKILPPQETGGRPRQGLTDSFRLRLGLRSCVYGPARPSERCRSVSRRG